MTCTTDLQDQNAMGLTALSAGLDECDDVTVRAVLATAAGQLVQRLGSRAAANEIHSLAFSLHSETQQ